MLLLILACADDRILDVDSADPGEPENAHVAIMGQASPDLWFKPPDGVWIRGAVDYSGLSTTADEDWADTLTFELVNIGYVNSNDEEYPMGPCVMTNPPYDFTCGTYTYKRQAQYLLFGHFAVETWGTYKFTSIYTTYVRESDGKVWEYGYSLWE